ncbi:MAG TPA: gas vesicle protein GvpJ [Candidatus Angelobacter sp.]|nr:gas vesicle protein GvpJ [Candidatus Angelobacter sp.]
MPVERVSGGSSLIDVLDRILDKGIVIDAWVRISLVGIDLTTVDAKVVVASIETFLPGANPASGITPKEETGEPTGGKEATQGLIEVAPEADRRNSKSRRSTKRNLA